MENIIEDLSWRGLIQQSTAIEELSAWLAGGPKRVGRTLYCGFDPTAESLHVGSLMPLMLLRRFQKARHRPIALVGGATGMIGDPSGKSDERNLLSVDVLRANVVALERQMRSFLDFDGDHGAIVVNNFDWMRKFSILDFLRDVGKNFPVNVMLAKDSVKGRLDRDSGGISFTEFSYMLLQAYDFVHLHQQFGCHLQVGGSDQWGNITAGIDLGRRMHTIQLYGLTCPLLTKSDGTKMGKTESGTVWLSAERTSPYAFYQYWYNVDDNDVGTCLRFLTELDREQIESLDRARAEAAHKRESQTRLAEELTNLVHGAEGLARAQRAKQVLFGGEIKNLSEAELIEIFADVPSKQLPRARLDEGLPLIDALVGAGLCKSKGEARRRIQEGGAYVNNRRQDDINAMLSSADLASETIIVLRSGKKKYALLRFV